jgi:hypothetical protein
VAELRETQILNEASILAVTRFAIEMSDDDFADVRGDLFPRPRPLGFIGEIRLMSANPLSETADGSDGWREFGGGRPSSQHSQQHDDEPAKQRERQSATESQRPEQCAVEGCRQKQGKTDDERENGGAGREGESAFSVHAGAHLLEKFAALRFRHNLAQSETGRDLMARQAELLDQETARQIERAMREANLGLNPGDLGLNERDDIAGSEQVLGFGVLDLDVERLFHRHDDLDGIQSHGWSLATDQHR